jgi:hypothetical protein
MYENEEKAILAETYYLAKKIVKELNKLYIANGRRLYPDGDWGTDGTEANSKYLAFGAAVVRVFEENGMRPFFVAEALAWKGLGPVLGGYDGIFGKAETMGVGCWFWDVAPEGWVKDGNDW